MFKYTKQIGFGMFGLILSSNLAPFRIVLRVLPFLYVSEYGSQTEAKISLVLDSKWNAFLWSEFPYYVIFGLIETANVINYALM